jgi:hypothetical protein
MRGEDRGFKGQDSGFRESQRRFPPPVGLAPTERMIGSYPRKTAPPRLRRLYADGAHDWIAAAGAPKTSRPTLPPPSAAEGWGVFSGALVPANRSHRPGKPDGVANHKFDASARQPPIPSHSIAKPSIHNCNSGAPQESKQRDIARTVDGSSPSTCHRSSPFRGTSICRQPSRASL